jgi:hypothetical protein
MKKDGRFQIRIPDKLKEQIQGYADRHHTTVSAMVTRFFLKLLAEEQKSEDAEQL